MKKSKKENLLIAKLLFKESFLGKDLSTSKIRSNVRKIKKGYKSSAIEILKIYSLLLNRYLLGRTIVIESTEEIEKFLVNKIRTHFEKITGRSLEAKVKKSQEVLGGIRVTLSDTQWDYTVKGKINQMKEVLSGRYSS
jgi:F0F1-type ATP synthase delta subunit